MNNIRSEFSANILLTQGTGQVKVGSTFAAPAPKRHLKRTCKLVVVMKRIHSLLSL
jgi:hypothetical protein